MPLTTQHAAPLQPAHCISLLSRPHESCSGFDSSLKLPLLGIMESSSRSKKTLSTGSGPRSSRSEATPRPHPVDRTRSDTVVTRRPPGQNQHTAQGPSSPRSQGSRFSDIQISDVGNERDSTVSIRSDPFFRTYQSPQSTRLAVESDIAHGAISSNEDVRCLFTIHIKCP